VPSRAQELAADLAQELNRSRGARDAASRGGGGDAAAAARAGRSQHDQSPVAPVLFSAPSGQSVVSGLRPPDARNDLVALRHQLEQQISTAMGVPSAMLAEVCPARPAHLTRPAPDRASSLRAGRQIRCQS